MPGRNPRSRERVFQEDQQARLEGAQRERDRTRQSLRAPREKRERRQGQDGAGRFHPQKNVGAAVIDAKQVQANRVFLEVQDLFTGPHDEVTVVERDGADKNEHACKDRSPAARLTEQWLRVSRRIRGAWFAKSHRFVLMRSLLDAIEHGPAPWRLGVVPLLCALPLDVLES